jgi:ABC-type branched-subunit amino acid transport system substrate-binding protein
MPLFLLALGCFLAACSASTAPVVKIGLVAPFEGRFRAVGYEAIYAARLAIREINSTGGVNGFRVELFALDDGGDPGMAVEQARKLAIDPQVVAVVGHFRPDTTSAAIDGYCAEALTLLAVSSDRSSPCPSVFLLTPLLTDTLITAPLFTDPASFHFAATVPLPAEVPDAAGFVDAYSAIPIDGTRAGPIALQTYDAMHLLFDALSHAASMTRGDVAHALVESDFEGLGETYRFDSEGNRIGAPVYVFEYSRAADVHLLLAATPAP